MWAYRIIVMHSSLFFMLTLRIFFNMSHGHKFRLFSEAIFPWNSILSMTFKYVAYVCMLKNNFIFQSIHISFTFQNQIAFHIFSLNTFLSHSKVKKCKSFFRSYFFWYCLMILFPWQFSLISSSYVSKITTGCPFLSITNWESSQYLLG